MLIAVLLMAPVIAYAIPNERIQIIQTNDADQIFNRIIIGIDQTATNGIDTALGEAALPPFLPPGPVLHGFCVIEHGEGQLDWSYLDIRPIPDEDKFYVKYQIKLQRGEGRVMWLSRPPLSNYIDSIKVTDIITENIYIRDFADSSKITIENPSLNDFFVHVWYNKIPTSVEEIVSDTKINIYPQPANTAITIKSDKNCYSYIIYDMAGNTCKNGKPFSEKATVDVSDLAAGIYTIVIFDELGTFQQKMIIIE